MPGKQRLDLLLVEKGLFPSREKAKKSIMAGLVKVDGRVIDKAGTEVSSEACLEVKGPAVPYVSRGGLKLAKAVEEFGLQLAGRVVVDVGASTGGFTDCVLQQGAAKVYTIDVGYGQLAWQLRRDPRVVNLERTNIRYFNPALLQETPDFVTVDVSFIALAKVLPKIAEMLTPGGRVVALIKPQFEAGRSKVGKKGVVRDPKVHAAVIRNVVEAAGRLGFILAGLTPSPIKGPEGNIEYLAYLIKQDPEQNPALAAGGTAALTQIERVVQDAFEHLNNSSKGGLG